MGFGEDDVYDPRATGWGFLGVWRECVVKPFGSTVKKVGERKSKHVFLRL